MSKIKIGKIANTFGISGELKVISESDFVKERFQVGNKIYLNKTLEKEITSVRMHNNNILIKIENLTDINLVEKYKNTDIYFDKADLVQLENDFYLFQLENLDVFIDDKKVGSVVEVLKPSQTVLRIKLDDREILLPFVEAFVENVDLKENRIDINLIEGF